MSIIVILSLVSASEAYAVLSWGGVVILAGLYATRRPRERPFDFTAGLAGTAGGVGASTRAAGEQPIFRPFTPAVRATATVDPWPAPVGPPISTHLPTEEPPMPEIPDDDTEPETGDIVPGDVVHAPATPPLEVPVVPVPVIINVSDLEDPEGDRAIFISLPRDGRITPAQSAILERHLSRARGMVDDERMTLGFARS